MTSTSDYGLDDLYRSVSVIEDNEKDKSIMFEELYRASPAAKKVRTITEPAFRSPKMLRVVSGKAQLFNQLKASDRTTTLKVIKDNQAPEKHGTLAKHRIIGDEEQPGGSRKSILKESASCVREDLNIKTNSAVSNGLCRQGESGDEDEDTNHHRQHNGQSENVDHRDLNPASTGKNAESGKTAVINMRPLSSNSLSFGKHERAKEPVQNLMADFLLTCTSASYSKSSSLLQDGLQCNNTESESHIVRRVEAVNPFQCKTSVNQVQEKLTEAAKCEDVLKKKQIKEPKEYRLTQWIVRLTSSGGLIVEGHKRGDSPDQMWHSSGIVKRINNRRVSTAGGSIYILVGPLDKQEAQQQNVPKWLVKIFKDGFPVAWKGLLQQENEPSLKKTSNQTEKLSKRTSGHSKAAVSNTDKRDSLLDKTEGDCVTPQTKQTSVGQSLDKCESPSDHPLNRENKILSSLTETPKESRGDFKMETPNNVKNNAKRTISSSVKEPGERSKLQTSFLHYKQGDVVSFEDLPQTRTGRKVVPPLSWWTGQRLFTDKCNTTTVNGPFSPEVSSLDITVEVSTRQERIIYRGRKKLRISRNSRLHGKTKDGFNSEGTTSTVESDTQSLVDTSCVNSDPGEGLEIGQRAVSHPQKGEVQAGKEDVRDAKAAEAERELSQSSVKHHKNEEPLPKEKRSSDSNVKGNVMSQKRKRLSKGSKRDITQSHLDSDSSKSKGRVLPDSSTDKLSTPKHTADSLHHKASKEKVGKFSVRKTRSMTGLKSKAVKKGEEERDVGPTGSSGKCAGKKTGKSWAEKAKATSDKTNKTKLTSQLDDILIKDSPIVKASKKHKSASKSVIKETNNTQQKEIKQKSVVKRDVLMDSSLFVDEVIPQNSIVCEEDFLSEDTSPFEVRSDIMEMLEARRKVRLTNKPHRPTCYRSPHLNIDNIVQTKNHNEKYYLKKALLHNVSDEVKEKVIKDSPVVELVNVQGVHKKERQLPKKNGKVTKKINVSLPVMADKSSGNSRNVKQNNGKTEFKKCKKATVVEPSQKLDMLVQPQKKVWTKLEIERLKRAMYEVPDYVSNYWDLVCKAVQTRTAEECYSYHYSSMASRACGMKKKVKKTQDKPTAALTGRVGTLKRKRELREIMDNHNQNCEGDLFDSTPYRKNKRMKLDITENDDLFSQVDAMFTTPGVKGRGSWPLSEKTPLPNFISPGILKDPNRNDADVYMNRVKKAKHVFHKSRNALPATMSKPASRPMAASKLGTLNMNSDWFKVQEQVEEGESEEEDLYFSDDNSVNN